jgi:hypothetical protein
MRHENAMMKKKMAVMLANMMARSEAADRWGPAHGQAPPEESAEIYSFTRTRAELVGVPMADKERRCSLV